MAKAESPFSLLHILERNEDHLALLKPKRIFETGCIELLRHRLPPEADAWIELAEEYRLGRAKPEQLDDARVAAWQLKERGNISDGAIRALIGLLWPDESLDEERVRDDIFEGIYYCIFFTQREGISLERIAEEMRNAFSGYLNSDLPG